MAECAQPTIRFPVSLWVDVLKKKPPGRAACLILVRVLPREALRRVQKPRRRLRAPETSGDSPRPEAWTVKESVVLASIR